MQTSVHINRPPSRANRLTAAVAFAAFMACVVAVTLVGCSLAVTLTLGRQGVLAVQKMVQRPQISQNA